MRTGPGWDASDASYAAEVAARFDNIVPAAVTPEGRSPLDILPAVHARSRTPTRNGGNILWLNVIADRMAGAGERVLLTGDKGNAVLSMTRPAGGLRAVARWVLGPLRALQPRPPRPGERFYVPAFRAAHAGVFSTYASFSGRDGFVRFAMLGQRGWGVDPMAQWGIELRDPTGDRALIEHVLRLPDAVLYPDGCSRGLARRLGQDRVPDRVRLRRTRGEQVPELPAIAMAHRDAYRDVLERAAKLAPFRAIFDSTAIQAALAQLDANDSAAAHTLTRIADIGLFLLRETA
ncbi:MAG: asparagine synthase C-terminal domain-containing protein [Rhizomicrobium sp.]